jgi:hypothetical protein
MGKSNFFFTTFCLTKISIDSGQATSENLKEKRSKSILVLPAILEGL